MTPSKPVQTALTVLLYILIPIALVMTSVRLLMTPLFLEIEYRTPGFPDDDYGFSFEERLKWSKYSLEYLLNDQDITFITSQFLDDGSPLYSDRELVHMEDVKVLVKQALNVWVVALLGVVALGVWAWRGNWMTAYKKALVGGGWLTIGLLGAIVLLFIVAFSIAFVAFHEIFFDAGTWTFYYSDTFIRLFPERFWRDAFVTVGGVSILQAYIMTRIAGK